MNNKPKYAGWVIAIGALIGAIAGALAGNMGLWLALGVAIGLAIGFSSRRKVTDCPQCEEVHRTHELRGRANSQVG